MSSRPLAEWSDDDIRKALVSLGENVVPITDTTRPFLLRKIQKSLQAPSEDTPDTTQRDSEAGSTTESLKANEGALQEENIPVEGYYVLVQSQCMPLVDNSEATDSEQSEIEQPCPLYTTKAAAVKAMKSTPGGRFKKFESKEAALAFWKTQQILLQQQDGSKAADSSEDPALSKPGVSGEKANNYPSLKTPALNQFRKLIEGGKLEQFSESVWSNPRYLITSGDTPEILQLSCRYNALHCAVKSGQLELCKELMNIVQGDRFWELVYPDDSDAVRQRRKDHLVDLYLNGQDKGSGETPLHFACKYGREEIVAFLVGFSCTCQTIKNKYGQVPADVVCSKDGNKSAKSRIEQLLKEPEIYYVPVLRSVDNSTPPQLFSPCTLPELTNQSPLLNGTGAAVVGSPIVGHALAGPMSPSQANEFYREWRSPSQSQERKETSIVKRSDPERGLERVGRKLAHSKGVGWMEQWDFLGCPCDLSLPDGQQLVEDYLKELSNSTTTTSSAAADLSQSSRNTLQDHEDSENPLSEFDILTLGTPPRSSDSVAVTSKRHTCAMDGVSRELFAKNDDVCENGIESKLASLSVNDVDAKRDSDFSEIVDSLADLLEKNLSFTEVEETDFCHPSTTNPPAPVVSSKPPIFLAGSKPSKLDLDVLRALDGSEPDPSKFPHLHNWLKNVKSFSEQQQKCWRTPTSVKHRSFKNLRSSMDTSSQPISPLVYSSPSSSSVRHNHSLSTSSPASNHPATTTPNRQQQTMTPGRYFDFRHASPQTRGVVGYRGSGGGGAGGGSTTPQRSDPWMQPRSVSHFRAPL